MNRRVAKIGLMVLAACVGLGVAVWASLRTFGFGPAVVVLTNVGSERVESLTIAEVSEGMRDVLLEHAPVRLGPVESATLHLERTSDAEIQVRLTDATGAARRVRVHEYLSHGRALTLEIDIADGALKQARSRRGKDAAFHRATWTSDGTRMAGRPPCRGCDADPLLAGAERAERSAGHGSMTRRTVAVSRRPAPRSGSKRLRNEPGSVRRRTFAAVRRGVAAAAGMSARVYAGSAIRVRAACLPWEG